MSRRHSAEKKRISSDTKYNSLVIQKFINYIMLSGKKSIAESIVYGAFDYIEKASNTNPMDLFNKALDNVKPKLELKSVRLGGASYQVPNQVDEKRAITLALRWIITASKNRAASSMIIKLGKELIDAAENKGAAIKKKEDTHRMADANKAFAHFATLNKR